MSVILPQIPARLRRVLGRFVGPAGAALFSLVLASCAGGGFGGAPDTPAVNPASQPAPAASGPISPASQRNVAEALSGLKLGDETPPISPEDIAVSDDAEILNRNPFSSPAPAARASGWGARADSTRKTQGYKAFEVAVPSENPLMTVAVWISETPPDYPEGKPEQDPESDRKFLYLRLQVFIEVGHVALVEGGGVEVLDSQVIVVEEKRPDPKPQPKPQPVTLEAVTAETVCESGSLSANGLTQAQLDYEFLGVVLENDLEEVCNYLRRGANIEIRTDQVGRPHHRSEESATALMIAGRNNYSDLARLLLSNGADVDSTGGLAGGGWAALHIAAYEDHADVARVLLDGGGDVNVLSSGGDPPLYQAAHWGRADMVQLLLSRGADPDIQANTGVTPLHGAATDVARSGSAAVVSLLLSYDADPNLRRSLPNAGLITRAGETGHSPLDDLVARGYGNYAEAARILRDAGGKCFVRTSPLCGEVHVAVDFSSLGAGTVSAEGDGDALSDGDEVRQGATVMFTATPAAGHYVSGWSGDCAAAGEVADGLDGAAKFCAAAADSDLSVRAEFSEIPSLAGPLCPSGSLSTNGLTQAQLDAGLISAAKANNLTNACEYLRRGANIEVVYTPALRSGDAIKRTPLVIAAANGRLELSRLLLNNGANVNWQSGRTLPESAYDGNAGWSALALAAAAGRGDVVGLLLDRGANVDIQWDFGRTALHEAAIFGRASVVELLLARGAAVDVRDLSGETALHGAAWGASPGGHHTHVSRSTGEAKWDKALDLLLDAGAEVNLRSTRTSDWGPAGRVFVNEGWNGGWTPLDRAVAANKRSRALKLRSRGGFCNVQSGPLCPTLPVTVAVTTAVTTVAPTVVTAETVCESGSLSANGLTQAQLDAGLVAAVKANNLTSACEYLRRGADVETREATPFYAEHRRTPLMIAANLGFVDVAGLLLGNGANVNRQIVQSSGITLTAGLGWSALHYASGSGHQDMAEYLLDQGADIGAKWSFGRSALFEASWYAHWETVELLLSRGADVGEADAEGWTPLHAVGYGQGGWFPSGKSGRSASDGARVVNLLLDAGADVNARGLTSWGGAPLDVAASRYRSSQSAVLRDAGGYCYVETRSLCAYPPVVTAVTTAVTIAVTSETVCESGLLSANGLTQAQLDAGLVAAVKANNLTSACEYLRRGADVETREATPFYAEHRRTPLMIAANLGFVDVAGLLLGNGANVNRQIVQSSGITVTAGGGWSALHYASGSGHRDMAEYLLDQGADIGAKWSFGRSALFEASWYAHWETVELLLSRGADVGEADADGWTPLHAVGHGQGGWFPSGKSGRSAADGARVVNLLLDADADVNARGLISGKQSPLDVAAAKYRVSQSAALRDAGGYCYVETRSLCAYPPVTVAVTTAVTTVASTVVTAETVCESGSLSANGLTQAQLDAGLISAARDNDLEGACEHLRKGANIEAWEEVATGFYRKTPLIIAGAYGRMDLARLLLNNGADVDGRVSGYPAGGGGYRGDMSALIWAASHGHADMIELLLDSGAEVDGVDSWGGSALLYAGHGGMWEAVELLLSRGADANLSNNSSLVLYSAVVGLRNMRDWRYAEALMRERNPALNQSWAKVVSLLLDSGAEVNARLDSSQSSEDGFSSLDFAAWRNYAEVAELLRNAGGYCYVQTNSLCAYPPVAEADSLECPAGTLPTNGLTVAELNMTLRMAARGGDATRVCEALRRGAEVNDNLDDSEFTPLQEAVSGGHLEAVKVLLANGAEVNKRKDGAGHSPLDLAARDGEAEIAALLRNANGRCFVETGPLCQSVPVATPDPVTVVNTVAATVVATVANTVVAEVENTVAATVAAGSCPAGTLPTNGMTQAQLDDGFLGAALENDAEEVCEYLRRGASMEIREDDTGRTALMIAGRYNYADLARLLLSNGAEVDYGSETGWVALHFASGAGQADVAKVLLDGGADPNLGFGSVPSWKPLHEAAYYNKWQVMKVLLTSGANPNIQTARPGWRGGAPLHYVFDGTRSGSALAVSVLVAGGAEVNLRDSGGNSALDLAARDGDAASAEILRAAGGQCFVSTSSLCGSAPAPAAAAAESAPSADRLRESFAGAFNPSPAFGDAFGAASGSSERFLSRLDSLMRSTSGSGGNAWDSFAGWQRENEHGRMWFSTGQRGDFGFGAGVGGAGGDLSASPFAAMVGNGMLAGGETGLGAAGKLRIAAFADYQARSLLDGTDRQWTKWAASGTAIETAMTEAERFSGLAENQTRGAMTEIHLGGGDLGVALQAGAVSESDAMLSGTADDENLRGLRARTAFAGLSGAADLFGSGWRLRGSAHLGRSWAESERMLRDGDLWASAFSAGLERGGWLYSDDGFILRFSQPLRVESLEMDLIGADGASRLGADPSGRQLDVDAAYRLPLSGGGWLLLSAGVRRDGGHTSSSDLEAGALFSVERGF